VLKVTILFTRKVLEVTNDLTFKIREMIAIFSNIFFSTHPMLLTEIYYNFYRSYFLFNDFF